MTNFDQVTLSLRADALFLSELKKFLLVLLSFTSYRLWHDELLICNADATEKCVVSV